MKPKRIFLLRGNHEFDEMCSHYGFKEEIHNFHNPHKIIKISPEKTNQVNEDEAEINFDIKEEEEEKNENLEHEETYFANHVNINCYKYSEKLYDAFIKAFSYMPICAIVNKTSICLHGGLTPHLTKVENIQTQIQRPISSFEENLLLCDIVWGDPLENLKEFYCESHRGKGKLFNGPVVVNFLKHNNLKRLIRGHECVDDGIDELFNDKCITVFSASSYAKEMGNSSGILNIYKEDDRVEPFIFEPLKRLEKCEASYYKVQSFVQKKINRSSLPQISNFKKGLLLPLDQSLPSSFDHINRRYLTSSRKNNNAKENVNPNISKIHLLNPRPRKRLSRVFNGPHIMVPQIVRNVNKIDF